MFVHALLFTDQTFIVKHQIFYTYLSLYVIIVEFFSLMIYSDSVSSYLPVVHNILGINSLYVFYI